MFLKQLENICKTNIIQTSENNLEKRRLNREKMWNKKFGNELKKISEGFFMKKYEKISKKGKMLNKTKSKNTLNNFIGNNPLIKLHHKLEKQIYNLNITDRALLKKPKNGINLKQQIGPNQKNFESLKLKSNNKSLMIDCHYLSNNEKYDISGDKYIQKYKGYLSSLPSSARIINNTSSGIRKEKKIIKSSNRPFVKIDIVSKHKNKINNKKPIKNINTKKIIDNFSGSILYQKNANTAENESILDKISTNQRFNSEFSSFDIKENQEKKSNYIKIKDLSKVNKKTQGKILITKDNLLKTIKVNKKNYLEKLNNNNISSNNKINMKIHSYINPKINLASNNKINNLKKMYKKKERLHSCKFFNEKIQKLEKESLTEDNLKTKKLTDRVYKYNQKLKINQSSGNIERKNITFFADYIKNNQIYINSYLNTNRFNTNGNNLSLLINNNNSEIIRNKTNTNFNTYCKYIQTSNKKNKKSLLYKKSKFREEEFLKRIKMKIKSKAFTTLNSKDNSKSNIMYQNIVNTTSSNSKHNYTSSNLNNNKDYKNDKKIFINNIINVNNSNETDNNLETNVINNSNCVSYRFFGGEKIKSFKNKIIGINSHIPGGIDYSFNNQSQRFLNPNKIIKNKLQLRDIIINNKNKNDSKNKNLKTNIIKKNDLIKYHKISHKKLNINKEVLLNKEKKFENPNHKKYESSEIFFHNPQSKEFSNLLNIFPEINQESLSAKFQTDKNNLYSENDNSIDKNNENININISVASTLKECEYYKQECSKLSSYIINYYKKNNSYPKTELNFYKYGRLLGKGAFGKVNIALHLASGRLVAIKSFNKKKLTTRRAKRKIKTEIEVLSKLRNPFCTQIYDYFETDTHILIVMEYVCGDLLSYMRKRSKVSEPTAKIIFKQIIKGLQYIHKKKIVHRDIKLDNVLIDLTNTVKICDFGVSRILSPGDTMYEHCGTPAYIAPEIFRNEGYEGYSCDVWSAGVTLYYMLAGMQPFKGGKIEELKEVILKGQYEPIHDISKEANDLIDRMLKLNPKERISIEDILKHPWLKNVDIKNRQKLNLFTNAEKGLLAKYDVNYLSSPKEELIEVFTIGNLETKDEKDQKCITKSDILAPYNSYCIRPDQDIYHDLKIENDICRFNFKAQLSNIKYELSNNMEFDNGLIKTLYNSVENEINKSKSNNEITQSLNLSLDSIETFSYGLCDDVIKDIEELIGYNKNYLVQCLRKNEINYATATYYLMLKEELNSVC